MNTNTIAIIWANQIINEKKTYEQVPRLLKEAVADILIEAKKEELITTVPNEQQ